jgi:pilus assembly protein Flp/PilA
VDGNTVKQFFRDQFSATAIEYGLIAAGIFVAIITAVNLLGSQLQSTFLASRLVILVPTVSLTSLPELAQRTG